MPVTERPSAVGVKRTTRQSLHSPSRSRTGVPSMVTRAARASGSRATCSSAMSDAPLVENSSTGPSRRQVNVSAWESTRSSRPPETSREPPGSDSANQVNVPYVPRRSGVPIPDSVRAVVGVGGKLAGTLKIVQGTPCCSSRSQKQGPCLRFWTGLDSNGIRQSPTRYSSPVPSCRAIE